MMIPVPRGWANLQTSGSDYPSLWSRSTTAGVWTWNRSCPAKLYFCHSFCRFDSPTCSTWCQSIPKLLRSALKCQSIWARQGTVDSYEPDPIADEVLASEIATVLHMMQTGSSWKHVETLNDWGRVLNAAAWFSLLRSLFFEGPYHLTFSVCWFKKHLRRKVLSTLAGPNPAQIKEPGFGVPRVQEIGAVFASPTRG